jgi:CubicO group peptidase (beta-lactamase class C family)
MTASWTSTHPLPAICPELGDMRAAFQKTDTATGQTEYKLGLPERPMTVRDLLHHTNGLIYPELTFAYPAGGLSDATADFGIRSIQSFDEFLQSRIFAPLHMIDTGFSVPKEKFDRLVDFPMPERPPIWDVTRPPKLFSGDGGLVSTAPDYLRFCQMLLNGGELDGAQPRSPEMSAFAPLSGVKRTSVDQPVDESTTKLGAIANREIPVIPRSRWCHPFG